MKTIYELSYWLKKGGEKEKINKILEEMNFELIKEIPPKEKMPAYPINQETIGLFGTFYFYANSEKIEALKTKIKSLPEVLRFIILKIKALKFNNLPTSENESQ